MKVKAMKPGYHNHRLRKEGEVFDLVPIEGLSNDRKKKIFQSEEQFSEAWMQKLDAKSVAKRAKEAPKAEEQIPDSEDVI